MRSAAIFFIVMASAAALAGCVTETREIEAGVSAYELHVTTPNDLGDEAGGRAIAARDFMLDVMAVGARGERPFLSYSGTAQLSMLYGGRLQPLKELTFVNGIAAGVAVTIPRVFGKAVFWVEDSISAAPTWAAGASADIFFANPTIADLQASAMETPPYSTDLEGFQLRVGDRSGLQHRLVVTSVTNNGFYVTDIDGAADGWNSMFVFNFSRPKDLYPGDNLGWFSGGVAEHLGTTQLTFPTWERCTPTIELLCDGFIPTPAKLTNESTYEAKNLEALEAALVEVNNVQIQDIDASQYDRDTFDRYGQFKVRLYDVKGEIAAPIQVLSKTMAPEFDPRLFKGMDFTYIRGILTELNFKPGRATNWIINVRDKNDICGPGFCPGGE